MNFKTNYSKKHGKAIARFLCNCRFGENACVFNEDFHLVELYGKEVNNKFKYKSPLECEMEWLVTEDNAVSVVSCRENPDNLKCHPVNYFVRCGNCNNIGKSVEKAYAILAQQEERIELAFVSTTYIAEIAPIGVVLQCGDKSIPLNSALQKIGSKADRGGIGRMFLAIVKTDMSVDLYDVSDI